MRLRAAAAAFVGASLVLPAIPAYAGPVKITDTRGDANVLNDQGLNPLGLPIPNDNSTAPLSSAGHDIVSVTFSTTFITKRQGRRKVKVPTAMVVVLELAGAPSAGTIYRVTAEYGACTLFFLQHTRYASGAVASTLRACAPADQLPLIGDDPLGGEVVVNVAAKVAGSKITFTIPMTVLAKLPTPVKAGTALNLLSAHDRLVTAPAPGVPGATVPQIDTLDTTQKFIVGK